VPSDEAKITFFSSGVIGRLTAAAVAMGLVSRYEVPGIGTCRHLFPPH
jgi:hypothetical protein